MCIDNKRKIFYKGLSIRHEERMELNGECENGRRRRGERGRWVPLFYDYTVTIALVSERPINEGKSEGLFRASDIGLVLYITTIHSVIRDSIKIRNGKM